MKIVVYTAIIGGYDTLTDPLVKPDGVDFICFTDRDISSDVWEIRKVLPLYDDNTRTARKYKTLSHRYLKGYDWSIWVDGNIKIKSDITELCTGNSCKTYDHMKVMDKWNCVYDEANMIIQYGEINSKKTPDRGISNWKDDPTVIEKQMRLYKSIGYPSNNGQATTPIVVRNHNDVDVIKHNEDWWAEIKYYSKRDQLSFNYVAWKNDFNFTYLEGDSRSNKYFMSMGKHSGRQ